MCLSICMDIEYKYVNYVFLKLYVFFNNVQVLPLGIYFSLSPFLAVSQFLLGYSVHLLLFSYALHSLTNLLSFKFSCQKLCPLLISTFSSFPSFIHLIFPSVFFFSHSLCLLLKILSSQTLLIPSSLTKINKSAIGSKRRKEV